MWHKINDGEIVRSVAALPESERLPDGSWVTGFRGADAETVAAAGWVQSADLGPRPDDGHAQTAVWTLQPDGTVTGAWVQGAANEPAPRSLSEIAAAHAPLETAADWEAFRADLEQAGL